MGKTGYTPKKRSENGADIFRRGVFEAHICKIDFLKLKSWTHHFESQSRIFEAQDMMSAGLRWIDSHCHWWTQTCSNILFLLVTHFRSATRRVFLLVMGEKTYATRLGGWISECGLPVSSLSTTHPSTLHECWFNQEIWWFTVITHHRGLVRLNEIWGWSSDRF